MELSRGRLITFSVVFALFSLWFTQCGHRPGFLPLKTQVDGAPLSRAQSVIVFFHGYGGTIGSMDWMIEKLKPRLTPVVSVVRVQAPFGWRGKHWFSSDSDSDQISEYRRRALQVIAGIRREARAARIITSGFSQGATVALDLAFRDPSVSAAVALSPCRYGFDWSGISALRSNASVTIVTGTGDRVCPVGASRMMIDSFRQAGHQAELIEFQDSHIIEENGFRSLLQAAGVVLPL